MKRDPWWEATAEVEAAAADDLAACLIAEGADGVEIRTLDTVLPPGPVLELPTAADRALLLATYRDTALTAEGLRAQVAEVLAGMGAAEAIASIAVRTRDDHTWTDMWKTFFSPRLLGKRVWVHPPWQVPTSLLRNSVRIEIDPGMAFGTGHHATTAMCVALLEAELDARPVASLLDVGTGSGILAIYAGLRGVARVLATDNDPEAVRAAVDNVARNKVGVELTESPLEAIGERFSGVVANIVCPVLLHIAADLRARVADSGWLLLSGLQLAERDEMLHALAATDRTRTLRICHEAKSQGWLALLVRWETAIAI